MPPVVEYQPSIVTYFDILGFRSLLKTAPAENIKNTLSSFNITGALSTGMFYEQNFERVRENPDAFAQHTIVFSDLIVRVTKVVNRSDLPLLLLQELCSINIIQWSLLFRGILVRGAVTYGPAFCDGATVFGPALVRAYELESQQALYPRVIVDPTTLAECEFERNVDENSDKWNPWKALDLENGTMITADDGFRFANYFGWTVSKALEDRDADGLLCHKQLIEPGLNKHHESLGVWAKFRWLCSYHNKQIACITPPSLQRLGCSADELRVKDESPTVLDSY